MLAAVGEFDSAEATTWEEGMVDEGCCTGEEEEGTPPLLLLLLLVDLAEPLIEEAEEEVLFELPVLVLFALPLVVPLPLLLPLFGVLEEVAVAPAAAGTPAPCCGSFSVALGCSDDPDDEEPLVGGGGDGGGGGDALGVAAGISTGDGSAITSTNGPGSPTGTPGISKEGSISN